MIQASSVIFSFPASFTVTCTAEDTSSAFSGTTCSIYARTTSSFVCALSAANTELAAKIKTSSITPVIQTRFCTAFPPRKVILFFLTTLYQKTNGVSTDFNSQLPSQASSAMFSVLPWSPRCNPRPLLPARRVPQSRSTRRCPARRNFSRRSYQSFGRRP